MTDVIKPHGGSLCELLVHVEQREKLPKKSGNREFLGSRRNFCRTELYNPPGHSSFSSSKSFKTVLSIRSSKKKP